MFEKHPIRHLRASSKLPQDLWPEINRVAVYLYNLTLRYDYNWKSPYERLCVVFQNMSEVFMRRDGELLTRHTARITIVALL